MTSPTFRLGLLAISLLASSAFAQSGASSAAALRASSASTPSKGSSAAPAGLDVLSGTQDEVLKRLCPNAEKEIQEAEKMYADGKSKIDPAEQKTIDVKTKKIQDDFLKLKRSLGPAVFKRESTHAMCNDLIADVASLKKFITLALKSESKASGASIPTKGSSGSVPPKSSK